MQRSLLSLILLLATTLAVANDTPTTGSPPPEPNTDYFAPLKAELTKEWPRNRTVRFVFHGHSVPAGYFKTPIVRRFDAYPTLVHQQLCETYPTAVIDLCVTAIGGENSVAGAKRFGSDVLSLKPDVVFIDYSLNDRRIGLEAAEVAWRSMIERCQQQNVLVVLLTPTPDTSENIREENTPLALHAAQVRKLADKFHIPVIDSYAAFKQRALTGDDITSLMSQVNHPNRAGHTIVADLISNLFTNQKPH